MQQVTGLDNLFLCIDAGPATNAVIGDLLLLRAPEDSGPSPLERIRRRLSDRLGSIPPLRRAMSGLPVGINNTYLREVDVEVSAHVREVVVSPAGDGDLTALAAAVATAMEAPMPPDRPLWEVVVLTGLTENRIAFLLRVHHGIVDGPTLPVVVDLLSDNPTMAIAPAPPSTGGAKVPEFVELLARGLVNSALTPVRLLSIQGRTLQYLLGRTKHEGALALPAYLARMLPGGMSRPLSALVNGHQRMIGGAPVRPLIPAIQMQKTPFNGKLTERRGYVFSELSRSAIDAAAARFRVTHHDVVIAACAGALRRYMQRYGDVPDRPLILCVPASIRTGKEKEPWATHLSMLFAEFPTNLDDPARRLTVVHEDLKAARETFDALPMHMLRDASRLVPLTMLNVSMKLLNRAPEWAPGTPWNVVVAPVSVRADEMRICGSTVLRQWPVGFLTPGVGVNIGVYTRPDRVDVGFCGCPDLMPDLEVLARFTDQALDDLVQSAPPEGAAGKPAPRRPRTRPAAVSVPSTEPSPVGDPGGPPVKPVARRPRHRPGNGANPAAAPSSAPATAAEPAAAPSPGTRTTSTGASTPRGTGTSKGTRRAASVTAPVRGARSAVGRRPAEGPAAPVSRVADTPKEVPAARAAAVTSDAPPKRATPVKAAAPVKRAAVVKAAAPVKRAAVVKAGGRAAGAARPPSTPTQ